MPKPNPMSRRELLFGRIYRSAKRAHESINKKPPVPRPANQVSSHPGIPASSITKPPTTSQEKADDKKFLAVIQGRYCIAYAAPPDNPENTCTACHDHCPEPEAIIMRDGFPQVAPDKCTGCCECHDLCPATPNAILMLNQSLSPRGAAARVVR